MFSSLLDMADAEKQKRPPGRHATVDDEWKNEVRAALKRKGISRADLAREVGVTPSAITVLLRPGTSETRLAAKIARALDLKSTPVARPVALVVVDDSVERIMRAIRKMDVKQRESFAALAETVVEKR
jgi:lambda repressor-like predicted transcriptional regulator